MKLKNAAKLTFLFTLVTASCVFANGQNGADLPSNGTILEQAAYQLPEYAQVPAWAKQVMSEDAYARWRNPAELELLKIKYVSDGLQISGFIFKPKASAGKKFPVVIFNRGGVGEQAVIGPGNFNYLYEMHRLAAEGFVVLASQYRGVGGAGGRDEVGGADTNDVINLFPLAKTLNYVDMDRVFMWGYSRGALMTLQAMRQGVPIRAAVVVGAPTDTDAATRNNPGLVQFFRDTWPDYDKRKEEHATNRSPVVWANQLNAPLLILNGGADIAVRPTQAIALALKLEELQKPYGLVVYAGDDHEISANREDRLRKTIDWFRNPPKTPVSRVLARTISQESIEAAVKQYQDLKKNQSDRYDFAERDLNLLGYQLLGAGKTDEAIEIFKLNVAAYPNAFNTYDSLGEGYMLAGKRELAIQNYRKSLELNPQNTNAVQKLKELGQK
jgi:dienelactone hydrolase